MATIASLNVALSMGTAQFSGGVKKARAGLDSLGKAVTSTKGIMLGLGAALAGSVAVSAFKGMVTDAMGAIDTTAKLADRLGITTEALTGLRHAANLSGVGADQFDKALQKMTRNIGDAVINTGAARESMHALGLDAVALSQITPDAAFRAIADGIAGIQNPAERAKIATDIFGKSGQELLNTLMAGSAGIEAMAAETEAFGTAISRVDAAQVEAANDAMTRAGEVIQGLATQVAVQLAPYIKFAADQFTSFATSGTGNAGLVQTAMSALITGISYVADAAQIVGQVFTLAFRIAQKAVTVAIKFIVDGLNSLVSYAQQAAQYLGVELGTGGLTFLSEFSTGLDATISEMNGAIANSNLGATWGDQLRQGLESIKTESIEAAEVVAENAAKASNAAVSFDRDDFKEDEKKKTAEAGAVGALARGSAAALSAIEAARRGARGGDPQKSTAKNTELAAKSLREIERLVRSQGQDKVVSLSGAG